MKKIALMAVINLVVFAGSLFAQEQWNRFLGNDSFAGKLEWSQYGDFPYVIISGKEVFAIRVELDSKTWKNDRVHKLVGKKIRVNGPMYIVMVNTEYKNLKYIDLREGKGSIKEIK